MGVRLRIDAVMGTRRKLSSTARWYMWL
ncbi:hypothetical protein GQ600_27229 [Phytophthora cactorum]|nr:hypothetical protein GQ600_27229 [Phytophthora cactorum]